jgi:hypothetical protein
MMKPLRLALIVSAALTLSVTMAPTMMVSDEGGIPYLTGGVGTDEREQIGARAGNYNLKLTFAIVNSTQYLGDAQVTIKDAAGKTVLTVQTDGPFFYAKLPPGKYRVSATSGGQTQEKTVTVGHQGQVQIGMYFKDVPATASAAPVSPATAE